MTDRPQPLGIIHVDMDAFFVEVERLANPGLRGKAVVEIGDRVDKGQTLCILEAMKLMNELEAEISGTIREICVSNADPVEFGQVLFRIEPA